METYLKKIKSLNGKKEAIIMEVNSCFNVEIFLLLQTKDGVKREKLVTRNGFKVYGTSEKWAIKNMSSVDYQKYKAVNPIDGRANNGAKPLPDDHQRINIGVRAKKKNKAAILKAIAPIILKLDN